MKKLLIPVLLGTLALSIPHATSVNALDDYVNSDGDTQYGWSLVCTEENESCWEFTDGELTYCYAADGDFGDPQHVNNFAIRNLPIDGGDSYSVETTFIPSPDTNASIERTYGIVCYYQDADNFLIYWLQQKSSQWSGQFYGRVDGMMRYFYIPEVIGNIDVVNYFRGSEFADMWWDDSRANNSKLVGDVTALCTNTVTLKVESEIADLKLTNVWNDATETFEDQDYHCRKFTLHQIVDGEDFQIVYYVRDLDETKGDIYCGLYSNGFNYEPADFKITPTTTSFTGNVEASIALLPEEITSVNQIDLVESARVSYEDLLSLKDGVSEEAVGKLENAENAVGSFVDGLIDSLDNTVETYKDDVDSVSNLFANLATNLQDKVTKVEDLTNHINAAKTWKYEEKDTSESSSVSDTPSEDTSSTPSKEEKSDSVTSLEPTSNPESDSSSTDDNKSGCGGALGTSLFSVAIAFCLLLKARKN